MNIFETVTIYIGIEMNYINRIQGICLRRKESILIEVRPVGIMYGHRSNPAHRKT